MEQEKVKEAMDMVKAGISVPAVANELGISAQTIRNWMKAHGQVKPSATSTEKEVLIVEAYERGDTIATILKEYGLERSKLYYLLSKYSVETRAVQMATGRVRMMEEAIALYKQGLVIRQITEDTGIHQPTLHAELAKRGIPLRRPRNGPG